MGNRGHNRHGPKRGGCCAPFTGAGPRLVQCGLGRGLLPYHAWYRSRPRLRPHCTRRDHSSRESGTAAPPLFGPCLLWPRSPISATDGCVVCCARLDRPLLPPQRV